MYTYIIIHIYIIYICNNLYDTLCITEIIVPYIKFLFITGKLVVQKVQSELLHPWVRRYHQDRQSDSKYTNIYLEDANVA